MSKQPQHLYEFGPFCLDTTERLLLRDGRALALTPKAFETLVVLVERRGHLVEKDELMEKLWPETVVEEANLTNNVWALRKTLGEGENGLRYIETVPKRGYRFIATVNELLDAQDEVVVERHSFTRIISEEAEDKEIGAMRDVETSGLVATHSFLPTAPRPRISTSIKIAAAFVVLIAVAAMIYRPWLPREIRKTETIVPSIPAVRSIAILPFKTIGAGNSDSEYLGIGMSDALITRLGNNKHIVVRSTSSVRRYDNPQQDPLAAGREQGVEAVLDGSVQRVGDRIRLTVQLFRSQDGVSLWSAKFDERFTNIFAVQDSISQQVMRELMVELNPEELKRLQRGSESVEAYEAYLKGLYFWNKRSKDGYRKAVEYFNRAVELDPAYAQAYVGLGNAYAYLDGDDPVSHAEAISKQRAAAKKALQLDDTLAEAHASLGLIAMNSDWDWPEAERELKRAIELNPNYATAHAWYGEFLACMGRFDEGLAEFSRAHELDPLSLIISTDTGKVYMLARRYDEAIAQYKRVLEMDPKFAVAQGFLAATYSMKGQHSEALEELKKVKGAENDPGYLHILGYAYAMSGRREEALAVISHLSDLSKQTYVSPTYMTIIYAALGEKDQSFRWLDRVFEERATGGAIPLKVNPCYDNLRSDPRFAAVLRRAGF